MVREPYANVGLYRARVGKSSTADDLLIQSDLLATSRRIDGLTNRRFDHDTEASARIYYPGMAGPNLFVDDIASTEDLVVKVDTYRTGDFTTITALDDALYQLWPLNAVLDEEPFNQIFIPSWSTAYWWSPTAPVEVTAIWGRPGAVPATVINACVVLTAIARNEAPETFEDEAAVIRRLDVYKRLVVA